MEAWNKEKVLKRMLGLYEEGVILRSSSIRRADAPLFGAINHYFRGMHSARADLACLLDDKGDRAAAEDIRAYNSKYAPTTKFSENRLEQRRMDLAKKLKSKVQENEPVYIRYQTEHDPQFVNHCIHAFGSYIGVFKKAGLDYSKYRKRTFRTKEEYLEQLIELILSKKGTPVEYFKRINMKKHHNILRKNLDGRFERGYYEALSLAKEAIAARGQKEIAEKIDVGYLRRSYNIRAEIKKAEKKESLDSIVTLRASVKYRSSGLPFVDFQGELTGDQIFRLLSGSDCWKSGRELSYDFKCNPSNIYRNLMHLFSKNSIRFVQGNRIRYLFHKSSFYDYYKRKAPSERPQNSILGLSKRLGVPDSKLRSVFYNLGLDSTFSEDRHHILAENEIKMLEDVLEREKRILNHITCSIESQKYYSFAELEIMGVPTGHLRHAAKISAIPFIKEGTRRYIQGSFVLDYFREESGRLRLSNSLRLMTHFNPHIYTIADLMQKLGLPRYKVNKQLNILLEENPNACFRIVKCPTRRFLLATEQILPFFNNWNLRPELNLLDVLKRDQEHPLKKDVSKTIKSLESILGSDCTIHKKDTKAAFESLRILRSYGSEAVEFEETDIAQNDLALIYKYMAKHGDKFLELDKRFSLEEIKEMLDDPLLLERVMHLKGGLEFALYQSNLGLAYNVANRMNLDLNRLRRHGFDKDMVEDAAQDGLRSAIQRYDPSYGARFSTFAYPTIRGFILNMLRKGKMPFSSLDAKVKGGDAELIEFFEDKDSPDAYEEARKNELNEKIAKMLSRLDNRKRDIIISRFGLFGRKKETLEDVGKKHNLTRERVRQLERDALISLGFGEDARQLKESYFAN